MVADLENVSNSVCEPPRVTAQVVKQHRKAHPCQQIGEDRLLAVAAGVVC
jgi:hypothetical protein